MPEEARPVEERLSTEPDGQIGRHEAREDPDQVRDADEHGQYEHSGYDPRRGENRDRVAAQRFERVDLLGDDHGAELGRDPRADSAHEHESG